MVSDEVPGTDFSESFLKDGEGRSILSVILTDWKSPLLPAER